MGADVREVGRFSVAGLGNRALIASHGALGVGLPIASVVVLG
jgi:hypothetical protein